jgi:hypothetical protein
LVGAGWDKVLAVEYSLLDSGADVVDLVGEPNQFAGEAGQIGLRHGAPAIRDAVDVRPALLKRNRLVVNFEHQNVSAYGANIADRGVFNPQFETGGFRC